MAGKIVDVLVSHIQKYPYDQVSFIGCILFCYPLGIIYRRFLSNSRVSSQTRHTFGLLWGVLFGWICFKWQLFNIIGTVTLCYLLTFYTQPKYVHRVVLIVSLAILSTSHLMRQIYDYGGYKLDYTGPLMILVQKVTYVAFSVHDGQARNEEDLTAEQKEEKLSKVPRPLEYFGYCLHYTMLLSGPTCTYRQYKEFIDGTGKYKKEESNVIPVFKKSLISLVCLVLFINVSPRLPLSVNLDTAFINSRSFLWRLLYAWISVSVIRTQYYFAFKAGEAVNNLCGLGFSGYDKDGNPLWDGMPNINILKVEFGLNVKMVLENWNISTVLWLRRTAYERLTNHRTLGVFVLSAVWHGFYGGYYLTFLTCQVLVEAARAVRRTLRDKFQTTPLKSRVYDVITAICTIFFLVYATMPFALLDLWAGLRFWRSMYYFGHVIPLLALLVCRGKGSPSKPSREKIESTDTNQNGVITKEKIKTD